MRILIITLPRTGGTNFGKWLGKELDYQFITEPRNYKRQKIRGYTQKDLEKDDIVVKYTFDELKYKTKNVVNEISKFDFSILHVRENVYEEARSWLYHEFSKGDTKNLKWHEPYFIYQDWEEENKQNIQSLVEDINGGKNSLLNITFDLYTTYEGLYYGDEYKTLSQIFEFEPKYLDIINPTNRYLQGTKTFDIKQNKTLL